MLVTSKDRLIAETTFFFAFPPKQEGMYEKVLIEYY